jgi:hypothetical protein
MPAINILYDILWAPAHVGRPRIINPAEEKNMDAVWGLNS